MRDVNEPVTGHSADDAQWLAELAVESIGWLPLGEGAYLHVGNADPLVRREVCELTLTIGNYAKDLLFVRACI